LRCSPSDRLRTDGLLAVHLTASEFPRWGMINAATTAEVAARAIRYFLMLQVDLVDGIDLVTASRRAGFHQKLDI